MHCLSKVEDYIDEIFGLVDCGLYTSKVVEGLKARYEFAYCAWEPNLPKKIGNWSVLQRDYFVDKFTIYGEDITLGDITTTNYDENDSSNTEQESNPDTSGSITIADQLTNSNGSRSATTVVENARNSLIDRAANFDNILSLYVASFANFFVEV